VPSRSDDLEKALIALGEAIREARMEAVLTQEELALRAGIHEAYVSFLESGRRNPTWRTVRRISDGLGLPLSELARRAEEFERGERQ
jgi:transcriptional regulator with XRE-family HTH domain